MSSQNEAGTADAHVISNTVTEWSAPSLYQFLTTHLKTLKNWKQETAE